MDKITLGISILGGEVRAASLKRKGALEVWVSPASLEDLNGLGTALKGAVQNVKADGKHVAIVLAHPRLTDQVIEVPPLKGWKLDQVVQRRAQSSKTFGGDAVWSREAALKTKRANAVLLHLCPKAVIDQLTQACGEAQLHLTQVIATTTILSQQLKALPLEKDELAVLAAETGNSTTVVIGRKDGLVCLARVVRSSWTLEADKVNVDLTRSIGFAEQQTGQTVASVWLYGAAAQAQVPVMQTMLKLPVNVSPVPYSPVYWAEQAAHLSSKAEGNLISFEARQAPQRKRLLNLTVALLAFLLLATVIAVVSAEIFRNREVKNIASATAKIADLRMQRREVDESLQQLVQIEALTKILKEGKPPNAPAYLLGYLGEIIPDELVLTQLRIQRTNDLWKVGMGGTGGPGTNQPVVLRQALTTFSNLLSTGMFHFAITREVTGKPAEDLLGLTRRQEDSEVNTFFMEGMMR